MSNVNAELAGVPEMWVGDLRSNLARTQLLSQSGIVNRDYEGSFRRAGDTVHLTGFSVGELKTYNRATGFGVPDRLETDDEILVIDRQNAYDMVLDAIERHQLADKNIIAKVTSDYAYKLAAAQDTDIITRMLAGARAGWTASVADGPVDTAPATVTISSAEDFYDKVVVRGAGLHLNRAGAAARGRFLIVDSVGLSFLQLDSRFVGSGAEAADARLLNGQVGRAAGFNIVVSDSPLLEGKVLAGTSDATTVADQVQAARIMESETFYGYRVQGLHTYGAKVRIPEHLAAITYTDSL